MRLLTGTIVALLLAPATAAAGSWAGGGTVEYVLIHKFHEVVGTCGKVEARAVDDAKGLKVMARAPVKCFDSGNGNRDAHALEAVQAATHPLVVVKGLAEAQVLPAAAGAPVKVPVKATVELKGVEKVYAIEVTLTRKDAGTLEAAFDFPVSLTAHGVERPSLLFVPVDDEIRIRGTLTLKEKS